MESLGLSQRGLPGLHGMGGMGMGVPHSPVPVPHLPEFSPPVNGTSTVGNTMRGHPDTGEKNKLVLVFFFPMTLAIPW